MATAMAANWPPPWRGTRISDQQRELLIASVAGTKIKVYDMDMDGYTPVWETVDVPLLMDSKKLT